MERLHRRFDAERTQELLDEYLLSRISVPKHRKELAAELATVRERGVAFNRGDTFSDLRAPATRMIEQEKLATYIVVGGPSHRIDPLLDEIAATLTAATAGISQHPDPSED